MTWASGDYHDGCAGRVGCMDDVFLGWAQMTGSHVLGCLVLWTSCQNERICAIYKPQIEGIHEVFQIYGSYRNDEGRCEGGRTFESADF